jgi:glycosyl transferase family 1
MTAASPAGGRPSAGRASDVLIVSLGATAGLRAADEQLRGSLERAGVSVAIARAIDPGQVRTLMLTDLAWARAARRAARGALTAPPTPGERRAIIYSSTTAALLWPRAGAIRFDAPSAGNRPGRHGLWQRPLERRRLQQATLLLPWSEGGLAEAATPHGDDRALVLPVAVACSGAAAPERDIAAITYAANPEKKGLDRVLAAWRSVRAARPSAGSEELLVAGASSAQLARAGFELAGEPGVRVVGVLAPDDYRALLRRSRVFVCAPRREDYGIAQLEALSDGCVLVSTPAPGPYAALGIARELDSRSIDDDLALALRTALEDPRADYARRAQGVLAPFGLEALDRLVADRLLPRLLT